MAIPIACQQTLNNVARIAWREGRKNTDTMFQNRNTWTKRSQTYQQTKELDIDRMVAITGSSAGYLAQQEEGFTRTASGKDGVWVPTAEAAGQSGKRTKPIQRRFRRNRVRFKKRIRKAASSPAQANLFKMYNAVLGNGMFYGKMGQTTGLWVLSGSVAGGRLVLTNVRLIYSADKKRIRTAPHEWHGPSVVKAVNVEGDEYHKALKRQWARLKRKNRIK